MLDSLTATGGEQDKQTHRNRGCSVTKTWTNKRFPGRLMILSTRKNDSCSWGVLPPISSLNHVYTCNMVYLALVNSIPQLCMYMQHGVSSTGQQHPSTMYVHATWCIQHWSTASLNHVCTCNMVYPALVNSLKLGGPNSSSWAYFPQQYHIVIFIQQNGQ